MHGEQLTVGLKGEKQALEGEVRELRSRLEADARAHEEALRGVRMDSAQVGAEGGRPGGCDGAPREARREEKMRKQRASRGGGARL